MKQDKAHPQEKEDGAKDKAGVNQTDKEKGILPKEERAKKREELEKSGKVTKRPHFNGTEEDDNKKPLQFKP